jgi:hypothetical protein
MDSQTLLYILAAVLVVVGILGTILPALPGLPLVFAGMLLAAWVNDFQNIGAWTIAALAALTLLSFVIDFAATAMGAKRVGASRTATIGAVLGMLAGLFFGLPGLFLGPFAGAAIGETIHQRRLGRENVGHVAKVGLGTWLGVVFGVVLKLALAFAMLGIFLLAWYV